MGATTDIAYDLMTPKILDELPKPLLVVEDVSPKRLRSVAALNCFAEALRPNEYQIVEDDTLDGMRPAYEYDAEPKAEIEVFIQANLNTYAIDRSCCDFLSRNVTWNTNGYTGKSN